MPPAGSPTSRSTRRQLRNPGRFGPSRIFLVAATLAAALAADPSAAQTPATAIGLGYPVQAVDARAAALGGARTGLLGGSFGTASPADLTEFTTTALSVTGAPESVEIRDEDVTDRSGRSRFSVIRAILPLDVAILSLGVRGELDQDWAFSFRDTLSTSQGDFPFEERRESDGGLASASLELAREFGPVSVGVGAERMTGSLRQLFSRRFEISVDSAAAAPGRVDEEARWSYEGWRLRTGLGVRIDERLRVSGAYVWSGDLTAERAAVEDSRTLPMPSGVEIGASFSPDEDWLVAGSAAWTGWADLSGHLDGEGARDGFNGGGGVEYRGLELASIPLQVRGGARYAELPFSLAGEEPSDERAVTLGVGSQFAGNRASLDLALEFGSRGEVATTGVEESFRRFLFTASVRP